MEEKLSHKRNELIKYWNIVNLGIQAKKGVLDGNKVQCPAQYNITLERNDIESTENWVGRRSEGCRF